MHEQIEPIGGVDCRQPIHDIQATFCSLIAGLDPIVNKNIHDHICGVHRSAIESTIRSNSATSASGRGGHPGT